MRRKRILLLLAILSSACLLGGCLSPVQLNERAIVQAVGIDLEQDGSLKLTLQIFSPSSSGGSSIGATAENAKIIESKGGTVSEAVQAATLIQGKQLFVGHNRIVILGAELAKNGLGQALSYFSSNPWSRQNVHLAVAEGKAGDILKAKINQGILPAETLEKILDNSERNGLMRGVKMYEFLKSLENRHESAILPVMKLNQEEEEGSGGSGGGSGSGGGGGEKGGSGEGKGGGSGGESKSIDPVSSVQTAGMAVFSQAKMVGILNMDESRGMLWIRNDIRQTTITASTDIFETAALSIYESKAQLVADTQQQPISFTLDVSCKATLGESMIKSGKEALLTDFDRLARAGEDVIRNECRLAFQKAVKELHSDIFNFGNLVWFHDIETWKELREDWPSQIAEADFHVNVHLELPRVGMEFDQTNPGDSKNTASVHKETKEGASSSS